MRAASFDILLTSEVGLERAPDGDLLAFAAEAGRSIYTANVRDFARLHSEWLQGGRSHRGIVVRHFQQMPAELQLRALHAIHRRFYAESIRDLLLYADNFTNQD